MIDLKRKNMIHWHCLAIDLTWNKMIHGHCVARKEGKQQPAKDSGYNKVLDVMCNEGKNYFGTQVSWSIVSLQL